MRFLQPHSNFLISFVYRKFKKEEEQYDDNDDDVFMPFSTESNQKDSIKEMKSQQKKHPQFYFIDTIFFVCIFIAAVARESCVLLFYFV